MSLLRPMFLACLLLASSTAMAQNSTPLTPEELASRTVYRRAVDATIWGVPTVSFDAMRQAAFRDAKASYNDIIWWPKGAGWKNQSLTVNTSVRYMYFFCNTKEDGPVVVDLPPAVSGASFFGTIEDSWFVPLVDIGGDGKGSKYLLLPPDYAGDVPSGYIAVHPKSFNTMTLLRSIVASASPEDVSAANTLVGKVKVYPLSKADNPGAQRLVDMTDIPYDGLVHYDDSFFTSLSRMLNEEPVQPERLELMGMLLPLGIEKGKDFKIDPATQSQLSQAAAEAHAWLVDEGTTSGAPWWANSQWTIPTPSIGVETLFHWNTKNYFDVDSRGISLAAFFAPTASIGSGSFYLAAYKDSTGDALSGENSYRLHIPAKVPVSQFWAFTVYGLETSALFPDSARPTIDSLDATIERNGDGSVDIYIGPKAPAGHESNWIFTPAGQRWFPWFRFYGPQKALLDKSWTMPDIERLK